MGNLFQILFSAVKAKIVPIWTKIKLWTNLSFLRTRVFTKIRRFFIAMLDVRPRDKKDYYGWFGWLISKRLAIALVIVIGLLSCYYIFVINPPAVFTSGGDGIKTYSYDSIPLRFTKGKVRILAKSRYVAYEGEVEKGAASGRGSLFREDGSLVYEGQFEHSMFNGEGKLYYDSGQLKYAGGFLDNLYDGTGRLFRENGSMEYEGAFLAGLREGTGTLFNSSGKPVFAGNFSRDRLLYTDLLGITTAEAGKIYTGKRTVYTDDTYFAVDLQDIGAVYYGYQDNAAVNGEIAIEGVYVLEDSFWYGGKEYTRIQEMEELFEKPEYEGNAYLIMPEAAAIRILNQKGVKVSGDIDGDWDTSYSDVVTVNSFDPEYVVYLYTYVKENLRYTFYCKDRSGLFSMYLIEKQE